MIRPLSTADEKNSMKLYLLTFLVAACAACTHLITPGGSPW
ncbi:MULTISPECIES: hypothetical protein [Variovorax]|jgi:hypothetical protein|uniref:Uncharacterized protein n=1 Tax=Variovorax ginsengisoli TaxID=363844 RepID=A0ABT8S490_9BURK|nr:MULTISPECIES: hypothetical protein [Variovorax]MDM0082142.1 hypothetical protein [Variovorax sp. J31P179]MDN8612991.1 hypothetical protein [Variovorax ginsengisoli]MDO1532161.1 hypothetical protein [Variovorax ginsengisoli]HET7834391.1 hypothetical protein [Variovorax sp.]